LLDCRESRDVVRILAPIQQHAGGPVGVEVVQLSGDPDGGEAEGDPAQRDYGAEATAGQGPGPDELPEPR
jgi:hypothetical protein